ncbi:MAG: hypothetical protein ACK4QW_14570 [Alphaproteobacteria bacterium]
MRIGGLVLLMCLSATGASVAWASADEVAFSPAGCDFRLSLPAGSAVDDTVWGGRRTFSISALEGRYAIRAACTTGYQPGALADLDRDARVAFVARLAHALNLAAPHIASPPVGSHVDVAGRLLDAPHHLRVRILYGPSSRFMGEVAAEDETTAETRFAALNARIVSVSAIHYYDGFNRN